MVGRSPSGHSVGQVEAKRSGHSASGSAVTRISWHVGQSLGAFSVSVEPCYPPSENPELVTTMTMAQMTMAIPMMMANVTIPSSRSRLGAIYIAYIVR